MQNMYICLIFPSGRLLLRKRSRPRHGRRHRHAAAPATGGRRRQPRPRACLFGTPAARCRSGQLRARQSRAALQGGDLCRCPRAGRRDRDQVAGLVLLSTPPFFSPLFLQDHLPPSLPATFRIPSPSVIPFLVHLPIRCIPSRSHSGYPREQGEPQLRPRPQHRRCAQVPGSVERRHAAVRRCRRRIHR
ncbi:unnamed protein product, partial [Phaeothamnion confervicola]